ncbi:MAG: 50S ribosomal protein L17 [bacterium]
MKHQKKEKKLGRNSEHRQAMKQNMARQMLQEEQLKTTKAKAKFIQPFVEKLVTRAAEDTVHNRREVRKKIGTAGDTDETIKKLFEDLGPRFEDRPGGYTRILQLDRRRGDGAQRALIEFVE